MNPSRQTEACMNTVIIEPKHIRNDGIYNSYFLQKNGQEAHNFYAYVRTVGAFSCEMVIKRGKKFDFLHFDELQFTATAYQHFVSP